MKNIKYINLLLFSVVVTISCTQKFNEDSTNRGKATQIAKNNLNDSYHLLQSNYYKLLALAEEHRGSKKKDIQAIKAKSNHYQIELIQIINNTGKVKQESEEGELFFMLLDNMVETVIFFDFNKIEDLKELKKSLQRFRERGNQSFPKLKKMIKDLEVGYIFDE